MNFFELIVCKTRICCVPSTHQCIHEWGNKRSENGVGKNGSDIFKGGERIENAWPL